MSHRFEKSNDFSGGDLVKAKIAKHENKIQFDSKKCHTDSKNLTTFLVFGKVNVKVGIAKQEISNLTEKLTFFFAKFIQIAFFSW